VIEKAVQLNSFDVDRLFSSGGFLYFKRNAIQFLKGKKTMVFDSGTVYEKVTLGVRFNESIAFFFAIPFNSTFCHGGVPPL
jgi:hypothetical protein